MDKLTFKDYQEHALKTAIYPRERGLEYTTLGLVGEAGEIANKVKKVIRDDYNILIEQKRIDLGSEIGDVLWYCSTLASELNLCLGSIAEENLEKLKKRQIEGKIKGSGDKR